MDAPRKLAEVGEAGIELGASLTHEVDHGVVGPQPPLDEAESQQGAEQPLLRPVVKVPCEPAAGVVGGGDDPDARRLQLGDPRRLGVARTQRLLGGAPLGDVEDDAVEPLVPIAIDRPDPPVEHPPPAAAHAGHAVLQRERPIRRDRPAALLVDAVEVRRGG